MFGVFEDYDEMIQEQFIWPQNKKTLTKLKPFIEYEREKLRTELRQIATFQGKVVDFATNKRLLESKKKVAAALAGDEADKFFGINPDEIDQYYTGNEEYDNQINNINNKIDVMILFFNSTVIKLIQNFFLYF